jgi:hypothetical protein
MCTINKRKKKREQNILHIRVELVPNRYITTVIDMKRRLNHTVYSGLSEQLAQHPATLRIDLLRRRIVWEVVIVPHR